MLGREPQIILAPLLERARVLPVVELRCEVKAAMPASSGPKDGKTGKATAAAAAKKLAAKPAEKERVTIVRQEGTATLRFYVNERAARAADKTKVAKKFAEGMTAIEPAVNGVETIFVLKMSNVGLVMSRKIVRV